MSHNTRFSQSQNRAISYGDGSVFVLAGPGSGKTTVLTHRIRQLIEVQQRDPGSILVLTFTRAAAQEMQSRFRKLTSERYPEVLFGTFHSFFWRILREEYDLHTSALLTDREQKSMLQSLLNGSSGDTLADHTEKIAEHRAEHRTERRTEFRTEDQEEVERILRLYDRYRTLDAGSRETLLKREGVSEWLFPAYEQAKKQLHKLDYGDLAGECLTLFCENPKKLRTWQERLPYILVDEFQDINEPQYEVLSLLGEKYRNVYAVGDDSQSLYGFRGAGPHVLQRFLDEFHPELLRLEENYRSCRSIVRTAERLIAHNHHQLERRMSAVSREEGETITVVYGDPEEECRRILERIWMLHGEGTAWEQIAVLTRTARGYFRIADACRENGIPIYGERDPGGFSYVSEDLKSYRILAEEFVKTGRMSRKHLLRVMNRPYRNLSGEDLLEESVSFADIIKAAGVRPPFEAIGERNAALRKLEHDLSILQGLRGSAGQYYILRVIGYESFLQEKEPCRYREVLKALERQGEENITAGQQPGISLSERRPRPSFAGKHPEIQDGVRLMTYHGSKGLEFDAVFLPGLNEGRVPDPKARTEQEIEEERRMLYVAMTRARTCLELSCVKESGGKDRLPSRFLREWTDGSLF